MFKSLYNSFFVATLIPCVVALVVLVLAQRKRTLPRAYATVFSIGIAADAFLNGPKTPVPSHVAWMVGVFFVIFGDLRYFVVVEESLPNASKLIRAVGWAFIVPVASQIVRWTVPRIEKDELSTFLLYEIFFFVMALFVLFVRVPRATDKFAARRATQFELVQYGLWIAADVGLITTHADAFYLLRIVPNLLYYVVFVPFMTRLLER